VYVQEERLKKREELSFAAASCVAQGKSSFLWNSNAFFWMLVL
jgi:hypothetical protein